MSLYDLPPELIARVLDHLAQQESDVDRVDIKPHVSQYASTSFGIQYAVEQHFFSRLSLMSDDTFAFEKIVAQSPRRQALLRTISFTPILPAYHEIACSPFERRNAQQANSDSLTAAMSNTVCRSPRLQQTIINHSEHSVLTHGQLRRVARQLYE
jgi:hypothetical protein